MKFLLTLGGIALFALCACATIFNPASQEVMAARKKRQTAGSDISFGEKLLESWKDQSIDRDNIIGVNIVFLLGVMFVLMTAIEDYHLILAAMAAFIFMTHGFLLKIPNKLHHAVQWSVGVFDVMVIGLELWAALSTVH